MVVTPSWSSVRQAKICATTGARYGVEDQAGLGAALGGLERARGGGRARRGSRRGRVPMFHPARACSWSPFQAFSLICSRYHSATPCLTRRTRTVVALTPVDVDGLVGGEQRDALAGRAAVSSLSALNVSRPDRFDVLAHDGGEPGRRARRPRPAGRPARRRGACRRRPAPQSCRGRAARCPVRRTRCPSSDAAMNHPAGSQCRTARNWRRQRRGGVLEREGGCPAQERDRDGRAPARSAVTCGWLYAGCPLQ